MHARPRRIRCFAKVNLGLRVLGRREDGFHDLRTILQTIDLHDTLEVLPSGSLSLSIVHEWAGGLKREIPEDGSNLVLEAARLAGAVTGRFILTKRIPAGAGLGGGSSDAAGTLLALADIAGRAATGRDLHEQAAGLGSDVPFFLYGGAALALGRGDEVYPLPDGPDLHMVLAFSEAPAATPEVYRAWDDSLTSIGSQGNVSDFAPWSPGVGSPTVENDLEEAAIRLRPSLKELRHVLEASGARSVAMTGSGSTFFGIYESGGAARAGLRRVTEAGYPAVAARGVSRAERKRSLWMEADGGVSQG